MWFNGVEVEQETSAPPPKNNPGSAPVKGLSNWPVIVLIIKIRIVIKKFLNNCKQNIFWRNSLSLLMPVRAEKSLLKSVEGSFNINYVCKYFRYFYNNY